MKKLAIIITTLIISINSMAQTLEERVQVIEDHIALKHLVDYFSVLADEKKGHEQEALFTPDAIVTSINDLTGNVFKAEGREQIGMSFQNFLDLHEIVYHSNGQQTLDIDGDKATGVSYCTVTMIRKNEDGSRNKSHMLTRYNDSYVKVDGKWLIKERTTHFMWQESEDIK